MEQVVWSIIISALSLSGLALAQAIRNRRK